MSSNLNQLQWTQSSRRFLNFNLSLFTESTAVKQHVSLQTAATNVATMPYQLPSGFKFKLSRRIEFWPINRLRAEELSLHQLRPIWSLEFEPIGLNLDQSWGLHLSQSQACCCCIMCISWVGLGGIPLACRPMAICCSISPLQRKPCSRGPVKATYFGFLS